MGSGSWKPDDWAGYTRTASTRTVKETFTSTSLHKDLDPKGVDKRESRDSQEHPNSHAIAIFLDVTGSMGVIAREIAATGLGTIVEAIYDKKPVSDPQILCGAIGDVNYDSVPLQVSQFESDMTMVEQIRKIYVEGGGGGNRFESYTLPLYFMAQHSSIDCFEKRGKKGYLFTIGDEMPEKGILPADVKKIIGDELPDMLSLDDVLTMVSRQYHVFHLIIEQGSFCKSNLHAVREAWTDALGQRAIFVNDYTKLGEIIVSTIQVNEGEPLEAVTSGWSGDTSIAVAYSVTGLAKGKKPSTSVMRF